MVFGFFEGGGDSPPRATSSAISGVSIMVGDAPSTHDDASQGPSVISDSQENGSEATRSVGAPIDGALNGGEDEEKDITIRRSALNRAFDVLRTRPLSDGEIMASTVAQAGLNAYGCCVAEVWVLNDDGTKFTQPLGGHWMDPAFASSLPSEEMTNTAWELRDARGE